MQYIVQCHGTERVYFLNYLLNNNFILANNINYSEIIESKFPFVIEDDNTFWICESITCCACAAQAKRIINVRTFINKKIVQ